VANGRLAGCNTDPSFQNKQRLLRKHATSLGTTVDCLALAAIIVQDFKPMVLSGAVTVEQLRCAAGPAASCCLPVRQTVCALCLWVARLCA